MKHSVTTILMTTIFVCPPALGQQDATPKQCQFLQHHKDAGFQFESETHIENKGEHHITCKYITTNLTLSIGHNVNFQIDCPDATDIIDAGYIIPPDGDKILRAAGLTSTPLQGGLDTDAAQSLFLRIDGPIPSVVQVWTTALCRAK